MVCQARVVYKDGGGRIVHLTHPCVEIKMQTYKKRHKLNLIRVTVPEYITIYPEGPPTFISIFFFILCLAVVLMTVAEL